MTPDRSATVVTPVFCSKLPNIPRESVTTAVVDFQPNAYTPRHRHRHPGSVTAFVLKAQRARRWRASRQAPTAADFLVSAARRQYGRSQ